MEKFSRRNLRNIQAIVEREAGVELSLRRGACGGRRAALLAACLACFLGLSAFACAKFSDLQGDRASFSTAYLGGGRFEIAIRNDSGRELELQDTARLMQWSTGEPVAGEPGKIKIEGGKIAPHSQGTVSIDISEGYDVEALEQGLPEGDWYYFVLTNNGFAFGQDWMCSFVPEAEPAGNAEKRLAAGRAAAPGGQAELADFTGGMAEPGWLWPTESRKVSLFYGAQENGTFASHVNIAGQEGDAVLAVADGVVLETGFDSARGNFAVLDLGGGVTVEYGHLAEICAAAGEEVRQGQEVAALGKTGMATGASLYLAVEVQGERVNPLAE